MKKRKGALLLAVIISLALGLPVLPASAPSIIYVDADATTGANNGTSWYDACTDLQSALAIATARDEIWVAAGIYKPTTDNSGPRYATFNLVSGVALYGGFAGDETTRDERDWVTNETILSGDIGIESKSSDNSYHVVTSQGTNGTILDGFIVSGGNADYSYWSDDNSGGGISIDGSTITVKNTIIYDNTAAFRGGGLNIRTTAGMEPSNVNIVNSIICNNISTGTTGGPGAYTGGGGICLNGPGTLTVTNSIINSNVANFEGTRNADGGGIRVGGGNTELNIINSTIVNNTCQSSVSVDNNNVDIGGGGIRSAITTTIINSILWGNIAGNYLNQILYPLTTTTQVIYSDIYEGIEGRGEITSDQMKTDDPLFVSTSDFHLSPGSPCIDAGKNYPGLPETDADGNERIVDSNGDGVAIVDMGAFEYLTAPQVATLDLIEKVGDLVNNAVLNPGQGNSLIVKLEAALHQMYRGQNNVAVNQLEAFINQVKAFMKVGTLSQEDGQALIDSANRIIEAL